MLSLCFESRTLCAVLRSSCLRCSSSPARRLRRWTIGLRFGSQHSEELQAGYAANCVLIRPDHHVAWRGDADTNSDLLGSNYFYHAKDPWGSFAEYSFGIDFVPVSYAPEDSFYLWGPAVPGWFVIHTEVQKTAARAGSMPGACNVAPAQKHGQHHHHQQHHKTDGDPKSRG